MDYITESINEVTGKHDDVVENKEAPTEESESNTENLKEENEK